MKKDRCEIRSRAVIEELPGIIQAPSLFSSLALLSGEKFAWDQLDASAAGRARRNISRGAGAEFEGSFRKSEL